MDEKLAIALDELKNSINNDPRIILLNELDNKINNSEEVMALAYKKDALGIKLNDALNYFKEDSEEVRSIQKELYLAKLALDTHPLVKEYNKAYKEVRKMYDEINDTLFSNFNVKHKCGEFDD